MKAAVQSLKKGKSAGVDNIPAELVQAGGEDVIINRTVKSHKRFNRTLLNGQDKTEGKSCCFFCERRVVDD